MPVFKIEASEVHIYERNIQAKTRDEAIEKFYEEYEDLSPCDITGFQIDKVIEGDDDE